MLKYLAAWNILWCFCFTTASRPIPHVVIVVNGVVPSLTTLATMRCQSTLSSEALMSCVGLTLSFHDAHKLSRYFSLWRPSLSSPLSFQSPPDFQDHAFSWRDPRILFISVGCTSASTSRLLFFFPQSIALYKQPLPALGYEQSVGLPVKIVPSRQSIAAPTGKWLYGQ